MGIKEQQFQENVGRALSNVVYKTEKIEAANYIKNHRLSGMAVGDMSALIIEANGSNDTCCFDVPATVNKKGDISEYLTSDGTIIKRSRSQVVEKCLQDKSTATFNAGSVEAVIDQFAKKSNMVTDIINDLMNMQKLKVEERIDPEIIKLLLEEEFLHEGINTDFYYGVVSQAHGVLLKEKKAIDNNLFSTPYKIKMFPGEFSMYPSYLSVYFPREKGFLLKSMSGVMVVSALFIAAIIFVFWYSLNIIFNQKKLAIVKNDFINNMTHELKTPISTISLACEVLKDKDIPKNQERLDHYVEVINEENKRLGVLVENVLQSAVWDRPDFKLNKIALDVHQIIQQVVDRSHVQLDAKEGEIHTDFTATDSMLEVDRIHFTNVLYNLIDNAIKYCKEKPSIQISTRNVQGGMAIYVSDNGIGISKEDQKKIFEKLYRVPTGNLHDVKGFGLGLSYVKAIIDQHNGQIQVKSQLNQGTTFSIFIPKKENYEH
ncbi:MAG: HAMP domain-containing sensor histidine kinase [Bacteroidetes bacterium]|nr:HAMP domain-containing sensor histidine kinase [Bacteroidota bacterium]